MEDFKVEKILSEKKIISKKDFEFIRKHSLGNKVSLKSSIDEIKRIFLGMMILQILFFSIGVFILFASSFISFISYAVAFLFGIIAMYIVAPVMLGAKLFFISLKE